MKQTTLAVNDNGILLTPRIKKYLAIIESGTITESELIALKSFINSNKDAFKVLDAAIWAKEEGLTLTPEQNSKGYDFLMDCWRSPSGKERKNNPFGYREEAILEKFTHFTLKGFYDAGNCYRSYYLPLYECHGNNNSFEYYYNGKVNIIG
jgi:hypothetical protein